ncbi:MAG: type II CRISPR-associated endonuclease Cas1 [bacterium]
MLGRIIEVADDHRHLFVHRGFMVVKDTGRDREELGRIPLDDIGAVIANAHGLSYTNNILVELAERGIPFVLCSANHSPVGMIWPVSGHHVQGKRIDAQLEAKKPLQKRLWAEVVKAKLVQQGSALEAIGQSPVLLTSLAKKVKSGDSENLEGQGARRYWSKLFPHGFKRDTNGRGLNIFLNYGYAVLRAATARAVIAAGLHPTIGLHHSNDSNPMRLVDDLMEPFRPLIDICVWGIAESGDTQILTPELKRKLALSLYEDLETASGSTPAIVCIQKLATSLAQVYLGERKSLEMPYPGLPLLLNAESLKV